MYSECWQFYQGFLPLLFKIGQETYLGLIWKFISNSETFNSPLPSFSFVVDEFCAVVHGEYFLKKKCH